MSIEESYGERNESSRPKKKKQVTRKEHKKTHAQHPAAQESFSLPLASGADAFGQYRLREKL